MKRYLSVGMAALLALAGFVAQTARAEVPGIINFRGRLTVNGNAFTGQGQFKFALIRPGSPETLLWSQDGSAMPANQIPLPVADGLFTIALGDTSIVGMGSAIPATAFDNVDVRLRVWFNDGQNGFAQLTPDLRITSAGYALRADNVSDGAITSGKIANGAVDASDLANGSVTTPKLADNAVTKEKLADGAAGTLKLVDAAVTTRKLADDAVTTLKLVNAAVTTEKLADGSVTGVKIAPNTVTSEDIADTLRLRELAIENVGGHEIARLSGTDYGQLVLSNSAGALQTQIGASTQGGYARINQPSGGAGIVLDGYEAFQQPPSSGGMISIYQGDGDLGLELWGGYNGAGLVEVNGPEHFHRITLNGSSTNTSGEISVYAGNGSTETIELLGGTGSGQGSLLTMRNGNGITTALLDADASGRGSAFSFFNGTSSLFNNSMSVLIDGNSGGAGLIDVMNGAGAARVRLDGSSTNTSGEISVFDDNGTETIELLGASSATSGGQFIMRGNGGTTTVLLEAEQDPNQGALLTMLNGSGDPAVYLNADNLNGGSLVLRNGAGDTGVFINGGFDDFGQRSGRIEVRNSTGATRVQIDGRGEGTGGEINVDAANGTSTVRLLGAQSSTSGGRIELRQANDELTVILDGEVGNGGGGYLQLRKGNGTSTITLDADSAGDGRITTQVLEITGGSDLSENFDIQSPEAEPGMIVRIDPGHPGELAVSDRAFDRAVAGVVSGAGGVKPGMLMGQRGSKADGKHPVALTGRVYCLVDASHHAIEPGDLITTSDTPGHGMKVTDPSRAQGAIIGKAMTALDAGKGLVLVLVSLQ